MFTYFASLANLTDMKYYTTGDRHIVAVDCIIFGFDEGKLKLLLGKRKFEPSAGSWSLMGGFVKDDESLDDAARRTLYMLTGMTDIYMDQVYAFGEINRDPGGRVITVAYYALIQVSDHAKELSNLYDTRWVSLDLIPQLVFDHNRIVAKALQALRNKLISKPIGFELLPEKFTLPQLQNLYEEIYQKELDKRNFRKQILETGLLEKLDEKDKENSKKGAFFYKFDKEKYLTFVEKGFVFHVKVRKDQVIKTTLDDTDSDFEE